MGDEVKIEHGDAAFTITCNRCGSADCEINKDYWAGSDMTSGHCHISIDCKKCGAEKIIVDV